MSVATRNPFSILDEEDARPPSPPPPSAPPAQQPSASEKRARGGPASRGGRYYQRGGTRQSSDREPQSEDPPVASDTKQRRPDGERREGRGRGRGAYRGRGRTFDKHSATGKTDSDKKIHNGWGGDDGNTERKVEEAAAFDAAAESGGGAGLNDWAAPADTPADDWGAPPQESAAEQPPEAEKPDNIRRKDRDPEEEDNTLTFDQYLAQQKEKESSLLPKLETRKANEGVGDTIWDGATRLEKSEGETYFSGKTKTAPKARIEKKEKVFLEIDAHFERPTRGGRGRGGDRVEGRGRGTRARGRVRGANGTMTAAVDVDDKNAFPSLS
ncbi:hypothetical protein EV363DRAFT_334813 [Boletus edulis]|uniref:Hyaluronan/mRNA-binding protein domain-containing protein n=1 Tax=Boletus edulis BED1 TaxID=1328754 RepID=A0AAD4GIJ6_BOLED|nr:hypothetical protein EV363DRAFT_334813 [Boletus edulis]KAF8445977.1 hypothetical protein L210DRAFT_993253 [Boletus edulis BED1]